MVTAEDAAEAELYYWICYCAWLTKKFEPYIIGSVVPFIRLLDLRDAILENSRHAVADPNKAGRLLSTFRKLELVELQQEELLVLCKAAKKAAALKFVKREDVQTAIPLSA